jgi:hypothetical protein
MTKNFALYFESLEEKKIMSVQEMVLQNSGKTSLVTNRMLGAVGMVLSPMLIFAIILFGAPQIDQPNPRQLFASISGVLYLLGAAASATAMRNLRVTGSGSGAAVLYFVQITGLFLAMWCDILEYAAPNMRESTIFTITDLAYPFSHLLMIIVGIAVLRAGVWRGWRRIPALLLGFTLPSFFAVIALAGRENGIFCFPLMVAVGFFLLGLAVFTTRTVPER